LRHLWRRDPILGCPSTDTRLCPTGSQVWPGRFSLGLRSFACVRPDVAESGPGSRKRFGGAAPLRVTRSRATRSVILFACSSTRWSMKSPSSTASTTSWSREPLAACRQSPPLPALFSGTLAYFSRAFVKPREDRSEQLQAGGANLSQRRFGLPSFLASTGSTHQEYTRVQVLAESWSEGHARPACDRAR
jgi:hypothetical protein